MATIPDDYYATIADLESSNNPNAYNKGSGASGTYQFLPSTWKALGYSMGDIFNPSAQNGAIEKLTTQNAAVLSGKGIAVNDTSLYAAHVLGPGTAAKVMGAPASTPLASIIGTKATSLNSWLGGTAGSAVSAIAGKVSAAGNGFASLGSGLASEASAAFSGATSGISSAFGGLGDDLYSITHPVSSVIQQIQAWLVNSGFFTRVALALFAVIILVAGFAMLKPVQDTVKAGAASAV